MKELTREQKILIAIEKGYKYNPETGEINGIRCDKLKTHKSGYIYITFNHNKNKYTLLGHQFAWYWVHKTTVEHLDHINGIKDDNRIINLRSVTHQENHWNQTTAKGYYWHKPSNKWVAQINYDSTVYNLGSYFNEVDARQAYLKAKEKYHIIRK